jgi:translation initiation factor IF-3
MVGVVDNDEAQRRAREAGLDLVMVASTANPPVCRIMDFGKFKYEEAKRDRASKAKSSRSELKEVRLGRSMKIDPHDVDIRVNQARRFLFEGHKVQIVQNFRGREVMHKERGDQRMKEIIEKLSDVGKLEVPPRLMGRRMTMILAPDRAKVEQARQRQSAAVQAPSEPGEPGAGEGPEAPDS